MRLMYAQFYAKYIKFYKYSIGIAVYFLKLTVHQERYLSLICLYLSENILMKGCAILLHIKLNP